MRRIEIAGFIFRTALVSAGAVAIVAFFVWRTPESPAERKPKLASQPLIVESAPIPDPAPLLIGPVAHPPTPTDYTPPQSYEFGKVEILDGVPVRHSTEYMPSDSYDLSYNPELRRMGMRVGSDGQPKRIAGDGEIPATWEDLRRAQGFGR